MKARIYPQLGYMFLVLVSSTFFARLGALVPATRTAVFVLYSIAILLCLSSVPIDELLADKLKISVPVVWVMAIASVVCLLGGAVVGVLNHV